ncbi:Satratoxin biosynthesis SC18 cluster protein [Paramyrothecium foliicola]|nr:Satratoxin biosynthesis SC18 cluster protein [Paramyrothecium foliicola]
MSALCLVLLFAWFLAVPGAMAQAMDPMAVLVELPKCAQGCLLTALTNSPCQMTNLTCMCTTDSFMDESTACVMTSCSVKEALTTKNTTLSACGVVPRDVSHEYAIMSNTLAAFIVISVFSRVGLKLWWRLGLQADDWIVAMTTLFFTIPCLVINVTGLIGNGMGRDVWTVPFEQITNFGMWFHIIAVLYFAQIPLLKLSLLVFCLRIFPQRGARKWIWITIAFNGAFGIAFVIVDIFKCLPVSYFHTRWDGEHEGTCSNVNAITWSNAAISIAVDIWMLAIPLSLVKSLNMTLKKKFQAGMWFLVGTLYTIVSMVRLHIIVRFGGIQNATWDYLEVCKWSTIEICVGIICVCMPYYRLLLARIFPNILGHFRETPRARESSKDHNPTIGHVEKKPKFSPDSSLFTDSYQKSVIRDFSSSAHDVEAGNQTENDEIQLVHVRSAASAASEDIRIPIDRSTPEPAFAHGFERGYRNGRMWQPKSP